LIDYGIRDDIDVANSFNPQAFNEGFTQGSQADGPVTTVTYTANDFIDAQLLSPQTVRTPGVESTSAPAISFDDVWSAPVGLKGGLEYIVNDKTTVFAAGGYTHAKGNESHVNAVDFEVSQTQSFYQTAFDSGGENPGNFSVSSNNEPIRVYDSQWLPQGQLNVGAEWQLTPGFALAAETGVRLQDGRDYADFTNAAGDLVEGRKGDLNVSIPVTLRGSINF